MNTNKDNWFVSLPKEMQELLDKLADEGLTWTTGPVWKEKPYSVELNTSTPAGEDMYIDLEEISIEALEDYVDNFDIEYNVSLWWENGEPGAGVPFDSQAEQVADYEEYLANLRDIIDHCQGNKNKVTHVQQLAIDKLLAAAKELELQGVAFTYNKKNGFTFKQAKK